MDTTEINDANLEGLIIGKDYLVVRVTINTLDCFDIFAHRRMRYEYYDNRGTDEIRYTNLFNNKQVQTN